MKTRRRCAEPDCRHAPNAHASGGCRLCSCTRWLHRKRHTWRDQVTEAWFLATHRWWLAREEFAVGNRTEEAEFEEHNPRPRLADFMEAMRPGVPPEVLDDLMMVKPCLHCRGTGRSVA